MQRNLLQATFDAATELKDAGAVTANGSAMVGGVARVINIGSAFLRATLIVDVDDLTTDADAGYDLILQGSTKPDFTDDVVNLLTIRAGDTAPQGESADVGVGRTARTFMNSKDGVKPYPYLRMFHRVAAGSINYRAFVTKDVLA